MTDHPDDISADPDRYGSAIGWEPPDPHKKARDKYRKEHPFVNPYETMLELRPASEWITRGCRHRVRPVELFGSLWNEGEVAVLFGETGAGKSILAVQIAESIARGKSYAFTREERHIFTPKDGKSYAFTREERHIFTPKDGKSYAFTREERHIFTPKGITLTPKPHKVLYLDFQRTERQFAERYSAPSPIPGKPPVKCRFKFTRAQIEWDGSIPEAFKNDLDAYMRHSILQKIEESRARVIIIDNILWLARNPTSDAGAARIMKTLKLWAATYDLSILLLARSKMYSFRNPQSAFRNGKARPLGLNDLAGSRHIAELADSVFAIAHSTFGPEYRYVKHLASTTPITHDANNVLTYRLERSKGATGSSASRLLLESPVSSLPSPQLPDSPTPFLGLTHLGPSTESDHLRDYAAEAREIETRERKALRKQKSVVEMLLSREYLRYLEP